MRSAIDDAATTTTVAVLDHSPTLSILGLTLSAVESVMSSLRPYRTLSPIVRAFARSLSTLPGNPHIYLFPHPKGPEGTSILSLLSSSPPNPDLAIATTTKIPPTPDSTTENPHFVQVLQSVCHDFATKDPAVQAQAQAFVSTGGSGLGSGGFFFPQQNQPRRRRMSGGGGGAGGGGAGGASAQGGAGGGGKGGWVHVSDQRNPPDWGRIAWPEDIFGSLEVDGQGQFVGSNGNYQKSGTYRIITTEGILRLSPFLREKLIARLKEFQK